jgi:hypothetical protein
MEPEGFYRVHSHWSSWQMIPFLVSIFYCLDPSENSTSQMTCLGFRNIASSGILEPKLLVDHLKNWGFLQEKHSVVFQRLSGIKKVKVKLSL